MQFITFIIQHLADIALIAAVIISIIYYLRTGEIKKLRQVMFGLVTDAEKDYGSGMGDKKFAAVAEKIQSMIPAVLRPFISADKIEKLIEEVLQKANEKWAENAEMQSYIEGSSDDTTTSTEESNESTTDQILINKDDLKDIVKDAVDEALKTKQSQTKSSSSNKKKSTKPKQTIQEESK